MYKILFIIILSIAGLVFFLRIWNFPSGYLAYSNNIKCSKVNGVFVKEYFVVNNPIIIKDTIIIDFTEVWLEYRYFLPEFIFQKPKKINTYQLVLKTLNDLPDGDSFDYNIGFEWGEFAHALNSSGKNYYRAIIKELPPDTIVYPIIKGQRKIRPPKNGYDIIGELVLIAK